jgi:hypothetical protein
LPVYLGDSLLANTLLLNSKMSLIRIPLEDFLNRSSRSVMEVLRTSSGTLGVANLTVVSSRLQVACILTTDQVAMQPESDGDEGEQLRRTKESVVSMIERIG